MGYQNLFNADIFHPLSSRRSLPFCHLTKLFKFGCAGECGGV